MWRGWLWVCILACGSDRLQRARDYRPHSDAGFTGHLFSHAHGAAYLLVPQVLTPAPTNTPAPTPTPAVHIVQPGDTLLGIALQYNVTLEELYQVNGVLKPELLQIGQSIVIPVPGSVGKPAGDNSGAVIAPTQPPLPVQSGACGALSDAGGQCVGAGRGLQFDRSADRECAGARGVVGCGRPGSRQRYALRGAGCYTARRPRAVQRAVQYATQRRDRFSGLRGARRSSVQLRLALRARWKCLMCRRDRRHAVWRVRQSEQYRREQCRRSARGDYALR